MTVGVDSEGSGEGGVGSKAGEGKRWMTVAVAIKGIIAVAADEITLNSLITRVTFGEIVLQA